MGVFVVGLTEKRLMPTTNQKARKLLQSGKAKVYCYKPFTIKLLYQTGGATQPVCMGVDTGSQNIGISVCANEKVYEKTEIALRSSMEKRSLMETRREYRRGRRYRKVRYRHFKWNIRTKRVYNVIPNKKGRHWRKVDFTYQANRPEGWLPPSLQSKVEHHVRWIQRYLNVLPQDTRLTIEVGRFDMAHMKDPTIRGELYQQGPQYEYQNVKAYVFDRDGYCCKVCKAKAGTVRKDGTTVKLKAHHIQYRSKGATDNPEQMVSVCDYCHTPKAHQEGGILYQWMAENKQFKRGYRDATTMNVLRIRLLEAFPKAQFTYGNITATDRERLLLPKGHGNDATAIALKGSDITKIKDRNIVTIFKQVRSKKRSLHEANPRKGRSRKNITAKRNPKNTKTVGGFYLWDKVETKDNQTGYISGFTGTSAYIVDTSGNYIIPKGKTYKQHTLSSLKRIHPGGNWIVSAG